MFDSRFLCKNLPTPEMALHQSHSLVRLVELRFLVFAAFRRRLDLCSPFRSGRRFLSALLGFGFGGLGCFRRVLGWRRRG